MNRSWVVLWGLALCYMSHSALGTETDANALPPGAVARLGWSPLRVGYASFALAADGRSIVVVTPQGNFRRLDAQTGRLLERRQLSERSDVDLDDGLMVHPALLSAGGERVALSELSHTGPRVTVYEVASGKMIFRRTSTDTRTTTLGGLAPDGKQVAVIETENKRVALRIYDLLTGQEKELGPFPHDMLGIHFFKDGKRLIVTAQDITQTHNIHILGQPAPHIVTAFDLPSGKELWRQTLWGMDFEVCRDGKMMLASGCPKRDRWEGQTGFLPLTERCASGFHVLQMDAEARITAERFVPCTLGSNLLGIASFVLAPDGRTLVINHFDDDLDAYIVLWDLRTQKESRRFHLPKGERAYVLPSSLALSPDGRTLLTGGEYVQRWDLGNGKFFFAPPDDGLPGSLLQLAFTPDGKEMLASSIGGVSARWNVATGKRIGLIHDNYGGARFIRTPDGLRTVRQETRPGNWLELTVIDPLTRKTLHIIRSIKPLEEFGYAALAANGKTLLAVKPGKNSSEVTTWNVESGRRLSHFTLSGAPAFPRSPFSPCGRWVLLNGKLYHAGSGTELFAPVGPAGEQLLSGAKPAHGRIWFSDDGRLMVAPLRSKEAKAAAEDTLAIWELATGQVLARFPKAKSIVQAAFAPDGRTLALLDAQGVRVEDLLSGKRLARYPASDVIHGPEYEEWQGLVFAPDGSTLATGHDDGSIVLWKTPQVRNAAAAALADGDIDKLWADLGSSSPTTARAAVERLVRHPDAAVPLLAARFRPPPADAKIGKLLKDLDSDAFVTREEASRQLRDYGAKAEPALRRTLAQAPSLEMRRRIESILADITPPPLHLPLAGKRLRGVRAIEVLEHIGNAAARELLQAWVGQTEDLQLALEARLALERLPKSDRAFRR